jgi:hypothetical protein
MDKIDQSLGLGGLLTTHYTDEATGKMFTHYQQDLTAPHEYVKGLKSDEYWKAGVKKGWAHAVHVPEVKVLELRAIGIDVFSPAIKIADVVKGLKALDAADFILRENA